MPLRALTLPIAYIVWSLSAPAIAGTPNGDASKVLGHGLPPSVVCPAELPPLKRPAYPCVTRDGTQIRFAKIVFATNKDVIRRRSYAALDDLATLMQAVPYIAKIEIQGHSDDRNRYRYGSNLSQRRAKAVRAYLLARGVDATRIRARGYGEEAPLALNTTAAGRALNRRIEVHIKAWSAPLPTAPKDCTIACHMEGRCVAFGSVCVPGTAAQCAASEACREHGHCGLHGIRCGPVSDADCAKTTGCKDHGRCAIDSTRHCVVGDKTHCMASAGCQSNGKCSKVDGRCDQGTDADCRRSPDCSQEGRCFLATGKDAWQACVARRRADCKASTRCHEQGLCSLSQGQCIARTNKDCRGSQVCRVEGRCTRSKGYDRGSCVIGSNHDCRVSAQCKQHGRCYRHDHFRCEATRAKR